MQLRMHAGGNADTLDAHDAMSVHSSVAAIELKVFCHNIVTINAAVLQGGPQRKRIRVGAHGR